VVDHMLAKQNEAIFR